MREIEITLLQFTCENCNLKSYINKEDNYNRDLLCPGCGKTSKNTREFLMGIKKYEDIK